MPLIKGSEIGQPTRNSVSLQPQFSQQQPEQSNFQRVARGIAQLGQGAAEGTAGILGIPGTIDELASGKTILPTSQSLQGHVQSGFKKILPEGYTQPQGLEERFLRNAGSSLPGAALALATGGAALPVGIATAGGAAGETAAQELGLGPWGEIAGSLLGSAGFTRGFHALQSKYGIKPENLITTATTAQQKLYDTQKKLGEKINSPAQTYKKKLLGLEKEVNNTSALLDTQKTELVNKIQKALGDISSGNKINAADLVSRKQGNNAFYKHFSGKKNKEAREYLDQLQKIIFEEGEQIGKKGKKAGAWLSSWRDADDITKVIKYGEGLEHLAEDAPKLKQLISHPLSKFALSAAGLGTGLYTGHGPLALGLGGSIVAAKKIYDQGKYLNKFMEKPATQKILRDAFKYTGNRQIPQLAKALHKFNYDAGKYAEKHPEVNRELRAIESQGKSGLVKGREVQ